MTPEETRTRQTAEMALDQDDTPLNQLQTCERQERLAMLGYYAAPVDGVYGAKSRKAVRAYRQNLNWSPGNDATLGLLSALRSTRTLGTGSPYRPMPGNGDVFERSSRAAVAPFEIKASPALRGYIIKVKAVGSPHGQPRTVKSFFVAGGDTVTTKLPTGSYQVQYAAGDHWLGYTCRFGKDTVYSRAETTFDFKQQYGQATGYRIELIPHLNGNLRTARISPEAF